MARKTKTVESTVEQDRERIKTLNLGKHTDQKYKEALVRIQELEAQVAAIRELRKSNPIKQILPRKQSKRSEATVLAALSDVHVGNEVKLSQTQGLNEYNIAICRSRCEQFFQLIVMLTDNERRTQDIDELILFLGGDIIDGALHLDTIMSNEISEPMEQAKIARKIIMSGLKYLEPHFKRITIVCKDGNHGRVTQKIHHSSRQGNALEWFMYDTLAEMMPQFNWIIENSLHTYLTLYPGEPGQRILRFHHGDTIGFGGVNGFYTYLNRRRYQWNTAKQADIDILGHLHQYTATKRFIVNGSVVGYNSYAVALGAEYEPAMQAFAVFSKRHGLTDNRPIYFT